MGKVIGTAAPFRSDDDPAFLNGIVTKFWHRILHFFRMKADPIIPYRAIQSAR
jgi:hypothetical protein